MPWLNYYYLNYTTGIVWSFTDTGKDFGTIEVSWADGGTVEVGTG